MSTLRKLIGKHKSEGLKGCWSLLGSHEGVSGRWDANTIRWMKQRYRLRSSKDFMRVRRSGKSYAHPLIILIASPNKLPISRFGVSASKAVGGAVSRNRAKRRIRAAVDLCLPMIKSGWDILLIARAPLVNAKWPRVEEAMNILLTRAQLLDDEQ